MLLLCSDFIIKPCRTVSCLLCTFSDLLCTFFNFPFLQGATRKVIVSTYEEFDPDDPFYREQSRHYVVYEVDSEGSKTLYRHFLLQHTGCLVELFEQYRVKLKAKGHFDRMLKILKNSNEDQQLNGLFGERRESIKTAEDLNSTAAAAAPLSRSKQTKKLFAGLESA